MKFVTSPSETVRIIGNRSELGNWDPCKGLILIPQLEDPTIWISSTPLRVEKSLVYLLDK